MIDVPSSQIYLDPECQRLGLGLSHFFYSGTFCSKTCSYLTLFVRETFRYWDLSPGTFRSLNFVNVGPFVLLSQRRCRQLELGHSLLMAKGSEKSQVRIAPTPFFSYKLPVKMKSYAQVTSMSRQTDSLTRSEATGITKF